MNPIIHPKRQFDGRQVLIKKPSIPSDPGNFADAGQIVTVIPNGKVPESLNGIAFRSWLDAPTSNAEWQRVEGQCDLNEPELMRVPGKKSASGVIIRESDGRIWLVAPSNAFAGYRATFPKGTQDCDLSLQATAIKETFEESGLRVRITGLVGDFERSQSVTRYYYGERTGGNPADMGWESQAVHLVPRKQLLEILNQEVDWSIVEALDS